MKVNILLIEGHRTNGRTPVAINKNFRVKSSSVSIGVEDCQKAAELLWVTYAKIQAKY